jgi:hypothetical protein
MGAPAIWPEGNVSEAGRLKGLEPAGPVLFLLPVLARLMVRRALLVTLAAAGGVFFTTEVRLAQAWLVRLARLPGLGMVAGALQPLHQVAQLLSHGLRQLGVGRVDRHLYFSGALHYPNLHLSMLASLTNPGGNCQGDLVHRPGAWIS